MTYRFFRVLGSDAQYDAVRLALDAEWGLPNDRGTVTCLPPAAASMRDTQGRIMLPLDSAFCDFPAVASRLPALLESGALEEIADEVDFWASIPPAPPGLG